MYDYLPRGCHLWACISCGSVLYIEALNVNVSNASILFPSLGSGSHWNIHLMSATNMIMQNIILLKPWRMGFRIHVLLPTSPT